MVTINKVAKVAGVSNATASRALRRTGHLKQSTIDKVENAAKELGYVVNTSARALKMTSRNKVGLIVSDVNNDYYHYIQSSIKNILAENGFELIVSFSSENPVEEKKSFEALIGMGASYIFFTPTSSTNEEIIHIAQMNNVKVVQLFRDIYDFLPSIINDDAEGAYQATQYLIRKNKKKILLLDVDYLFIDRNLVSPNRTTGYLKAIKENSLNPLIYCLNINKSEKNEIFDIIEKENPDGIIAGCGDFGYDVYKYAVKAEKHIDFISYDDNKWFEILNVSTIKQNLSLLADTIVSIVKDKDAPLNIILKENLIIR